MAWTKFQIGVALLMVVTGSINTLSTKWADTMTSKNSAGNDVSFNHPFFQADGMFIGEFTCMIAFYIVREITRARGVDSTVAPAHHKKFPPYIFWIPALCDMLGTSTMYVGLTLTYASSFQMLRGAVIIFTGLFSVAFLNQRLRYYHWTGMILVIIGLIIVGMSDFLSQTGNSSDLNKVITGDLLIICAQIIAATQMVVEQKFLTQYNVPAMLAVGWEGFFGFLTLTIVLIPMYYIPAGMFGANPRGSLEDPFDAFTQLGNSPLLVTAVMGNIVSIAFFNFAGVSVTKELSATTRMVLDSVRTFTVWIFSLAIGWQPFQALQPVGFVVLLLGMFLYNDVIILPFMRARGWIHDTPEEDLTIEEQIKDRGHLGIQRDDEAL